MMHMPELAATHAYWQPIEQAERERRARTAALLADARRSDHSEADRPTTRRAFIPRVAGALGLV